MDITGKIITLKPLHESFFEVYHVMFSPVVRQILGLPPVCGVQDTINFLKAAMVNKQYCMFFCIFDNKSDSLIGAVVIRSPEHPNGRLGSWLNENFWGGGRYQEALYLVLMEYFEIPGNNSIVAFIDENNVRSLRAHQKFGFEIAEKLPEDDKKYCSGKKTIKVILSKALFEQRRMRHE